jgi:hypothetical protein
MEYEKMTDTTKAPELKSCPICGKPPGEPVDATRILGSWRIVHRGCLIPNFAIERYTLHDAVSAWNGLSDHSDSLIAAACKEALREAAEVAHSSGNTGRTIAGQILALITKDQANG